MCQLNKQGYIQFIQHKALIIMKIAIIGNGFTGATLPMAHHLRKVGVEVDCYYLVKIGSKAIESLDFDNKVKLYTRQLSKENTIYRYLDKSVNIRLLPNRKRYVGAEKLFFGKIIPWANNFLIKKYAKEIIGRNYDFISIIVHNPMEVSLCRYFKSAGVKFSVTYHEILNRHIKGDFKQVVKDTIEMNVPVIVHSEKAKVDLEGVSDKEIDLNVIHFGQFESYLSYGDGKAFDGIEPGGYALFLGYLHPYKGLGYLYDAMQEVSDENIKVVVAGSGKNDILPKMREDKRFVVINRFIENDELVWLVKNSKFLICPYISASQSGLVQTAMVYNKCVVATNVGAFSEIIKDGENGYLVPPKDAKALSIAIRKAWSDNHSNYAVPAFLDWDFISQQYINLFKGHSK